MESLSKELPGIEIKMNRLLAQKAALMCDVNPVFSLDFEKITMQ